MGIPCNSWRWITKLFGFRWMWTFPSFRAVNEEKKNLPQKDLEDIIATIAKQGFKKNLFEAHRCRRRLKRHLKRLKECGAPMSNSSTLPKSYASNPKSILDISTASLDGNNAGCVLKLFTVTASHWTSGWIKCDSNAQFALFGCVAISETMRLIY